MIFIIFTTVGNRYVLKMYVKTPFFSHVDEFWLRVHPGFVVGNCGFIDQTSSHFVIRGVHNDWLPKTVRVLVKYNVQEFVSSFARQPKRFVGRHLFWVLVCFSMDFIRSDLEKKVKLSTTQFWSQIILTLCLHRFGCRKIVTRWP